MNTNTKNDKGSASQNRAYDPETGSEYKRAHGFNIKASAPETRIPRVEKDSFDLAHGLRRHDRVTWLKDMDTALTTVNAMLENIDRLAQERDQYKASADKLAVCLKELVAEIHLSKLNIRKDFSLINVHAAATKALYNYEKARSQQ